MTTRIERRRRAHLALAAVVSAIGAMVFTLYRFPPGQYSFYPPCPFHALTGLQCPGCGATRALAALLHGHLADAIRLNGLVVLLLPMLLAYGLLAYWRVISGREPGWPRVPDSAVVALLTVAATFTIARNLG